MNSGSFRGNAGGVKITFLAEIKSTKQANPKYTLMHYLTEYLKKNEAELQVEGAPVANFVEDLNQAAPATRIDADQSEAELNALVRDPTIWTILQKDDPDHLGLRYSVLPAHQMSLITSGCAPFRHST